MSYGAVYKEKIEAGTLLFKKIMSDFKKKLNKIKEKGKGRVAKRFFGPTFDKVRNNKNNTKKKTSSLRKKEKAIIIHQRCIICEKLIYKKLKTYYYAFFKIAPKRGTPSARTQETVNRNLKKNYIKKKLAEIRNKRVRTA